MSVWARLLTGVLEGFLWTLEALGARGSRWEWRKRAWRQAVERRIAAWENLSRGLRTRMRMCRACRTLVEGGARTCPACGASLRGVPGGGLGRMARLLLPGTGSLTIVLVSVNIALSLVAWALWGDATSSGFLGLLSPPSQALYLLGAKWTSAIASGEVWRLITASYLHAGLLHLLFNCYALMNLGPLIEESFGWRKLFLIYTVSGVLAFAASTVLKPRSLSVGASGALFGLLGFAIVFGRYRAGHVGRAISDHLIRWLLLGVVMFLIPGIDSAAHLGGLGCGAVLGLFVDPEEPRTPAGEAWLRFLTAAAILLTVGSFALMARSYAANAAALRR